MSEGLLEKHHNIMLMAQDPENDLMGGPIPALTTLLIKVCDNDPRKFGEAMRLVAIFIETATKNQEMKGKQS